MAEIQEDTVQPYLSKYKISSLFEDLKSKIIKELPPDPIDFLIKKLQILHRQKSKGLPRVSSTNPSKGAQGKIEVTGTSVKTPTNAKSPISDRLSKSTSGLRPLKPKSSTLSSSSASSLSKTTPTRPHTTSQSAGAKTTSKIPTVKTKSSKPVAPKASTTSSSKLTPTRPVTAPVRASKPSPGPPSAGKTKGSVAKSSSIPTVAGKSGKGPSKLASSSSSSIRSSAKRCVKPPGEKPKAQGSKQEAHVVASETEPSLPSKGVEPKDKPQPQLKEVAVAVSSSAPKHEAKVEEIAEFFGEPKKSSQRRFFSVSDADSEDEQGGSEGMGVESESDGEEGLAGHVTNSNRDSGISIEDILSKRRRCKHGKKSRGTEQRLLAAISNSSTPISLGDEPESEESDEGGVELMEDPDTLRDEGVEVANSKYTVTKSSVVHERPEEVLVCARCAKALGKTEQGVAVGTEFESASQVGSHASYPQWGSEDLRSTSTAQGTAISEGDMETSSDVTLESHDTWGGLAPAPPQPQISDEESELQLPPPPPLQGQTWVPETTPHDTHGWGQQHED